jgi:plastocyanin
MFRRPMTRVPAGSQEPPTALAKWNRVRTDSVGPSVRVTRRSAAVLLVAAIGLALSASAGADTGKAEILDFGFWPDEIHIAAGDDVAWTNTGAATHTVVADDEASEQFESERLERGATFVHQFERAGTFDYQCRIHPSMRGVVHVAPRVTTSTIPPTPENTTSTTASPATTTSPPPSTTTSATTIPPPTTPGPTTSLPWPATGSTASPPPATTQPAPPPPTTRDVGTGTTAMTPVATVSSIPGSSALPATEPRTVRSPTNRSSLVPEVTAPSVPPGNKVDAPEEEPAGRTSEEAGPTRGPQPSFDHRTAAVGAALMVGGALWFLWQLRPRR